MRKHVSVKKQKKNKTEQPVHKNGQFSGVHLNASWEQPLILFFSNWDHMNLFLLNFIFHKKHILKVTEHSAASSSSFFFLNFFCFLFYSAKKLKPSIIVLDVNTGLIHSSRGLNQKKLLSSCKA